MGPEAEGIVKSFTFNDGDEQKFAPMLGKFDNYFTPRTTTVHERAIFNCMPEGSSEAAESFIRRLYEQAGNCNFGDAKDGYIRDRLLVGITDKDLRIEIQRKTFTLEQYISEVRQSESVKGNVACMQSPKTCRSRISKRQPSTSS